MKTSTSSLYLKGVSFLILPIILLVVLFSPLEDFLELISEEYRLYVAILIGFVFVIPFFYGYHQIRKARKIRKEQRLES